MIKGCRYDEIRSLYVEQLAYIWVEDSTETTRTSIEKKVDSFVEGGLEHAAEMVSALWKMVNKDGDVKAPSNTSPAVSSLPVHVAWRVLILPDQATQVKSPAHWDSVKVAFIKSIRTGVFFDRKYWARHSTSGDTLRPVYFSSTIMNDKAEQVNKSASEYLHCTTEALNVLSGKIPDRSECSQKQF